MAALQRHAAEECFGVQNVHILRNLSAAQRGVEWLVVNGFTVVEAKLGARRPVIEIQTCAQCDSLVGAMKMKVATANGPVQVMAAVVEGCQIQWSVKGI